ncbi:hypothetical protein LV89_00440 [Arcicella aurantiaca]|uniref:Uncharacterized protein n=1 Tax=Arcicella aurantiaca TaxID=591202 RepID=A0A316EE91_9BACT|nr:hypothetical protein [Arcicella aurantiaca]PWK28887.1 hypothetical protein LV89_00440 [Arcicella aurantiaca]
MKVQALISKELSSFNDELKNFTGSTEDFITLQVLLTNGNSINNNRDKDSELYILWHVIKSTIINREETKHEIVVTQNDVAATEHKVFTVEVNLEDDTTGYLVISNSDKTFKSADSYEISRLNDTKFKNYIMKKRETLKDLTFTAKSVNCSTSRYPC